ncbi:MAG: DUF3048 domain-containing protein [Patescibacteria group bacterium]
MIKRFFESALPLSDNRKDNRRNLALLIVSACLLVVAIFAVVYIIFLRNRSTAEITGVKPNSVNIIEECKNFSKLTGLCVANAELVSPPIIAVMIENIPDAYPLHGLNDASIVYEAPVEGGITRFMAIYSASSTVVKAGPVRSARPYYLDWASEYGDALYMHCGGSPDGLDEIADRNIFDANEFYRGSYFWRDSARIAPHNLFTSSENWQRYLSVYGGKRTARDWTGFKFGDIATNTESVAKFNLEYIKRFVIGWQYSSPSTTYERLLNDELFLDDKNQPITADNIIVQFASVSVLDEVGRRKIVTVGSGDARVFRNGQMIRATWKKESENSRTRYFDMNGAEIAFTPGRTWIMVAPLNTPLTIGN